MVEETVPDIVISRLPWYLQTLNQLAASGLSTVSSGVLAERLGTTAAQIRKDLSYFGGFGKQGTGYPIHHLIKALEKILNLDRIWPAAVIGAGGLGRALAHYQGFASRGFEIVKLYDIDPALIGMRVGSVTVQHVDRMPAEVRESKIKIGILTVPASAAQKMADQLVEAGIAAILNYAPTTLSLPDAVHVQNIDPALQLQRMLFYLGNQ